MRFFKILNRWRVPAENPHVFLRRGRQHTTHTLVACVGDSITHGFLSANYVEMLQQRFASDGYEFINAGMGRNLAWNILQRLDMVIACQPDVVTLLIGTNDVNATFNQAWEDRYRRKQNLPEKPTLDWYRQNVERIIERLQAETKAKIAILEIPILGENVNSELNMRVNKYNTVLKAIADEKQVDLLPLNTRLKALLPENHHPPAYKGKVSNSFIFRIGLGHLLNRSWNSISASNGLELLIDHFHLNEKAAALVVDLIGTFLNDLKDPTANS